MFNNPHSNNTVEVPFYRRKGERLVCEICPRFCTLSEGQTGICRGRKNIGGKLIALNYGRSASVAFDPMEKKPLYQFYPGTQILSVGANSCNFKCKFCQNYDISQYTVPTQRIEAGELIELSKRRGSIGIAYTYSEPLMWYEFLLDCCEQFKRAGMVNVLVTNGYINAEPLAKLLPLIDAMNIDLKSMEEDFYWKMCGGVHLQPVLHTIETAYQAGVHIELTQLIVTGANDKREQIGRTVDWISALGRDIPLHFSRYFPRFKYKAPATSPETLKMAYKIAKQKLQWVYVGNISLPEGNDSVCPGCGSMLVERWGYSITVRNLEQNHCRMCGQEVYFKA